ncbi:malate synthase A [Xanthovirga aplysinae]|uniref:malate synthase A n=1 Tax=Xanthovirga aplysinae TaxID=2529853 RepID=UPI0012BCC1E9|nr:malate synthase A [Xanthovirga aplysinae]MTI31784.1 malate synthase A [Xanthovirga aplysinae]
MNSQTTSTKGVTIKGPLVPAYEKILTDDAIRFLVDLHRKFEALRKNLLLEREKVQQEIEKGNFPDYPQETAVVRTSDWIVAPIPADLQNRRVEITGPVDRKMIINALNSGAKVFMADFEDATSPNWKNVMEGQVNLHDAIRRKIDFQAPNGKSYKLRENIAVLKVRPRGWHLVEKHFWVDGEPISASLFDFGLYFFHNAKALLAKGSGPYFYLPKLESYKEARLWNQVFEHAQKELDLSKRTIKATVLIETILAAFQMDEILFELRDHIVGLNAGRWDYIFSVIKKFKKYPKFIMPDRSQVSMEVPFMRAYAQSLVKVCHRREAHAIGGMSAFIPAKEEAVNQLAINKVQADKRLEATSGYDGTWVAHPFLIPIAKEEFKKVLGQKPHQKEVKREDVQVKASDLLNVTIDGGKITEAGLRTNINVGILYIESWLNGTGAAALYNLMEDAATAEISRAQVWQWLHIEGTILDDGRAITLELYKSFLEDEVEKIKMLLGENRVSEGNLKHAVSLFDQLVRKKEFEEFLTLSAYELL